MLECGVLRVFLGGVPFLFGLLSGRWLLLLLCLRDWRHLSRRRQLGGCSELAARCGVDGRIGEGGVVRWQLGTGITLALLLDDASSKAAVKGLHLISLWHEWRVALPAIVRVVSRRYLRKVSNTRLVRIVVKVVLHGRRVASAKMHRLPLELVHLVRRRLRDSHGNLPGYAVGGARCVTMRLLLLHINFAFAADRLIIF